MVGWFLCTGEASAAPCFKVRKRGTLYFKREIDVREHPQQPAKELMREAELQGAVGTAAAPADTGPLLPAPGTGQPLTSFRTSLQALRSNGSGLGQGWHRWKV